MKTGNLPLVFALFVGLTFHAAAVTRYVDLNSPSPTPPYTNWLTAATNIQDAVDAAVAGDTVLVTNGVYATGGKAVYGTMTNRVAVDKPLKLLSVNGPESTIIKGYQLPATTNGDGAIRCVYLTNGVTLSGFTLTNGATRIGARDFLQAVGGGLWCESTNAFATNCVVQNCRADYMAGGVYRGTLDRCVVMGNSAPYGGGARDSILNHCNVAGNMAYGYGGGAVDSTLNHCIISSNWSRNGGGTLNCPLNSCLVVGNVAVDSGGGSVGGPMRNCTVVGNSAGQYAGGSIQGTHYNCVIYANEAPAHPNFHPGYITLNSSCTTPMPSSGVGNITNTPTFVDLGAVDFRLQSNSPCINAGNNAYVTGSADLDGNPRIAGGTVDMGAFEFQSPASVLSYAWAQQNGLPTDGSADFTDDDADGANHWQEWRADTIPTNAASALLMGTATNGVTGLVVSWASVATRNYWLERGSDLGGPTPFQPIATNIVGVAGTKTFNDASATNGGPYFYRVGVQ